MHDVYCLQKIRQYIILNSFGFSFNVIFAKTGIFIAKTSFIRNNTMIKFVLFMSYGYGFLYGISIGKWIRKRKKYFIRSNPSRKKYVMQTVENRERWITTTSEVFKKYNSCMLSTVSHFVSQNE